MQFRLNKNSSQNEINFALTYPGAGNLIFCDDEIFNKIINHAERLSPEDHIVEINDMISDSPIS